MIDKRFITKSVNVGLVKLVEYYAIEKKININIISDKYNYDERVPFLEWLNMLDEVQEKTGSTSLGLEISNFVKAEHFGILGYICRFSDNLGDALHYLIKYHRLSYDFMDLDVKFYDQYFVISWGFDEFFKAGKLADETMISVFFSFINEIIFPERLDIDKIELVVDKPKNSKVYVGFFNCPIYFNMERTSVFFSMSNLNKKIIFADESLKFFLNKQAEIMIKNLPEELSLKKMIYKIIYYSLKNNDIISIEYIANKLGCSTRVLQYELKKEGDSFKSILEDVRKKMAIEYLSDNNLTVLEISYLLSYSQQTAFIRAFKSWTGFSPLQYRKKFNRNHR